MITAKELKAKAASKYESTLKKLLVGDNPFPIRIPYKRPPRTGNPSIILKTKELLRSQSKETVGFGPTIDFEQASTRRFGDGAVPGAIRFTTLEDLIRYIGKKAEAERVLQHASILTEAFPETRAWTSTRIRLLSTGEATMWRGVVDVVRYFMAHPKPWIYPRELPLALETKFLERHHVSVIELLAQVQPTTLNEIYTTWQDRLGLRSASELVEGRFLDASIAPHLPEHMLAPIKEWNRCAFETPRWVLITENRTTLLTLPTLSGCLALLGKGYAVTRLAQIEKLQHAKICYWGDIDQHGFEILASVRSHLPQTISCLMDEETLSSCRKRTVSENVEATLPSAFVADHLNQDEAELWRNCARAHTRLEQEKIPNTVAITTLQAFAALFSKNS